jgi:hypothetical protein
VQGLSRLRYAAQDRLHTGNQLSQPKGPAYAVVGARLQAEHAVQLGAAARQRHYRHGAARADFPADREPIHVGQFKVKDNKISAVMLGQRLSARTGPEAVISVSPQITNKTFRVLLVLIHYEHAQRDPCFRINVIPRAQPKQIADDYAREVITCPGASQTLTSPLTMT